MGPEFRTLDPCSEPILRSLDSAPRLIPEPYVEAHGSLQLLEDRCVLTSM